MVAVVAVVVQPCAPLESTELTLGTYPYPIPVAFDS